MGLLPGGTLTEPDPPQPPVLHLVVPGPLEQRTGGYRYDATMVERLRSRGWTVHVHSLEGRFPLPDLPARRAMEQALAALPDGALVLLDGLAAGGLPEPLETHRGRLRLVALVHHPLAHETGIPEAERQSFAATEPRSLTACRGVVVTSRFTAGLVETMGIGAAAIRVVEPGTDRPVPTIRQRGTHLPRLLCVASLVPRKGQDVLVEALALLADLPWECHLVGSLDRDASFADSVRRRVESLGLAGRIHFHGEVDDTRLEDFYQQAACFVLASHFEGFGMVLAEAMVRGLPVVATSGGAIPETVGGEGALLVPPGKPAALARTLAPLLDPATGGAARSELGERARSQGRGLPTWYEAVVRLEAALEELAAPAPSGTGMPEAVERFPADWLGLREPVDHRSRAEMLLTPLRSAWVEGGWSRVVDLGCGTGSNFHYLAPRLPGPQRWLLVDHDAGLLRRAEARIRSGGRGAPTPGLLSANDGPLTVEFLHRDLGDLPSLPFSDIHLVTASALLDLVSDAWLSQLVARCAELRSAALFTLTYDGSVAWQPVSPGDATVARAVNRHQTRDKGLGRALGPEAAHRARERFEAAGYEVQIAPSPWRLDAGDLPLLRELTRGWVHAATEEVPESREVVRQWGEARIRGVETGSATVEVGHLDLLALPPRGGPARGEGA